VALVSLDGARRLTFDTDVLSLLPQDNRVIQSVPDVPRALRQPRSACISCSPRRRPLDFRVRRSGSPRWVDGVRSAPEIARVDAGSSIARAISAGSRTGSCWCCTIAISTRRLRRLTPDGCRGGCGAARIC
jgi:hypothetical protein